jgi:hypothetical protein
VNRAEALSKISVLTKCGDCKDVSMNCCHDTHCVEVEKAFPHMEFQKGENPKARFLLENGCSVPPHFRASCSIHTCDRSKFKDTNFSRVFHRLLKHIERDPNAKQR